MSTKESESKTEYQNKSDDLAAFIIGPYLVLYTLLFSYIAYIIANFLAVFGALSLFCGY